jgi:hypothetical protein
VNCEQVQQDVAIALLGKGDLDAATLEHVANCPRCAAEQASLRPIVSLLPSVDLEDLELHSEDLPSDDLLERLLLRVTFERARSRRRTRLTVGTGLAVAASVLTFALASVPNVFAPAEHSVVASAAAHGIKATASIEPASGGSALTIQISGVARDTTCRLQVVGMDGGRQTIVTWVADYRGTATTHGTSTFVPSQLKQVTVREVGGPVLLTIPVTA